ncbi:putative DUF4292 domain-containing protein [Candidatus Magnetomoraceae bacterium gMMP-15]
MILLSNQKLKARKPALVMFFISLCFVCQMFLSGCAVKKMTKPVRALDLPDPINLISHIKTLNQDLKSFKGIGKFKISGHARSSRQGRAVLLGLLPERLRIEVLNPLGQPMMSLASDSKWLYFLSQSDGNFYKKRSDSSNLSRFILIPIKPLELVSLIAGQIPLCKYSRLEIQQQGKDYILILKQKWGRIRQKIYIAEDKKTVKAIERFDGFGKILYKAEFNNFKQVQEFKLPFSLILSNADKVVCRLNLDRFLTNIIVKDSQFVINH